MRTLRYKTYHCKNMFRINDCVKVKQGVKDTETGLYDMSGWQGYITKIDKNFKEGTLYTVLWDTETLKNLPEDYILEAIEDVSDFSSYNLFAGDFEKATPRGTRQEAEEYQEVLAKQYYWADFEEGDAILDVIGDAETEEECYELWFDHLEENVKFPYAALYQGDSSQYIKHANIVTVIGINEIVDMYGIIARCKTTKGFVELPLCDLKPDSESPYAEILELYNIWFANKE